MDLALPHRDTADSLRGATTLLLGLIACGFLTTLLGVLQAFVGDDFLISVITTSGPRSLVAADFTTAERLALVAVIALPAFCWMAGLASLGLLARSIRRGELLAPAILRGLLRFAACLAWMAAADFLLFPLTSALLVAFGKCDPIKDLWRSALFSGAFDSLMAAVLVVVLVRLLRIGFAAQEEAQWTV